MQANDILKRMEAALAEIQSAADAAALESVRVRELGRNGAIQDVMLALKTLAPADRPAAGKAANEFKNRLQASIDERKQAFAADGSAARDARFDPTLPGRWPTLGSRHPVSQIVERCTEIFGALGFIAADGPDIESVANNFDALNTPDDHPSRDPQDTFYLADGRLLRCHTSPVQVRYMKSHPPPIRIVAPGRCYRRDNPDATHSANFHQIEGLYVDRQVTLADLKGDLTWFARQLMGPGVNVRFRPHFFPFTEPSVEVDFSCHVCGGKGCRVCKQSGWIEIAGAGMVDPNVFRNVGYDPEQVVGYAFGLGIERMAMILFGIKDIRALYENDVRFLAQFGA